MKQIRNKQAPEQEVPPLRRATARCLLMQCFSVGGWLMLLLIKFGVGFPLSSEIGKCAIYVTAAFLIAGILAIRHWDKELVILRPEAVCLKDSAELARHVHRVFTAVSCAAVLCLLAALTLILLADMKTTEEPINRVLTNWPLYVLTGGWLGNLCFFVYDAVTLRLWLRSEAETEQTEQPV